MHRFFRFVVCALWLLSPLAATSPCHADDMADRAAAEALFQLGQRLMNEGNYAEACPKFDASNKLDPGVGTLLFLGDCQEKFGKLASAWATFQEAGSLAKSRNDSERVRLAELRSAALRPRLVYLLFRVDLTGDSEGFELRRNGLAIGRGSWGVRLPIDPGSYELVATQPGRETWHSTITVPAELSEPFVVQVPTLRPAASSSLAPEPSAPLGAARPLAAGRESEAAPPSQKNSGGSSQKTWAVVAGSVGIAALVVGGVLAVVAADKNQQSEPQCNPQDKNLCSPAGVSLRDEALRMARLSTTFGVAGGVLLATGTVLYVTAPRDERGALSGLSVGFRSAF